MFPIHKLIICPQNKTFCTARFSDSWGGGGELPTDNPLTKTPWKEHGTRDIDSP